MLVAVESSTKGVGEYVQGLRRLVGQERAVGTCGDIYDVLSLAGWRFGGDEVMARGGSSASGGEVGWRVCGWDEEGCCVEVIGRFAKESNSHRGRSLSNS